MEEINDLVRISVNKHVPVTMENSLMPSIISSSIKVHRIIQGSGPDLIISLIKKQLK